MTETTALRMVSRSPIGLAKEALQVAQRALPPYSSKYSRKDFTQHQLFAILVLRQRYRTDYRGIIAELQDNSDLCNVLKLKKLPHHSTLWYAQDRLVKKGLLTPC